MVQARVRREHTGLGVRPLPRRAGEVRAAPLTPDGVLGLQRTIGNRAVTRLLQRVPTARAMVNPTRTGGRLGGGNAEKEAEQLAGLRAEHRADARAILADLTFEHLWGRSKSDVTGTGEDHDVRIDRQNPTPNASNIQIQTNGRSISIATVLVRDTLAGRNPAAVLAATVEAFRGSLDDGMQWEVYDEVAEQKAEVSEKGSKKKSGGSGKKSGGGGGGRRTVKA